MENPAYFYITAQQGYISWTPIRSNFYVFKLGAGHYKALSYLLEHGSEEEILRYLNRHGVFGNDDVDRS